LDYLSALSYIENIQRSGSIYGLERMKELLDLLDNIDSELKIIHVAGTNGKGSTTAYLTSILKEAGYKVGTYNSPSVFSYNERWLINGKPLENKDVAKYMTIVRSAIENEQKIREVFNLEEFNPTAFEIETAVAILAFYNKECNVCVLETGLGGRWDATNAVSDKVLSIITRIGLDHCYILGNTLKEIASEKAAIIKDDVVTCKQDEDVMNEIAHPYLLENNDKKYRDSIMHTTKETKLISSNIKGQKFEYDGKEYEISLLGIHQLENASLAIEAVNVLRQKHFDISDKALLEGLKKARWHARFEIVENAEERFNIVIPDGKTLVFDGSHNPQGATTLANAVKEYFENKRVHLVLGILKDKDVDGILNILLNVANKVTTVTPPSIRALDKDDLKAKIDGKVYVDSCNDIKVAVQHALDENDSDVVVLCGSLTLFENL